MYYTPNFDIYIHLWGDKQSKFVKYGVVFKIYIFKKRQFLYRIVVYVLHSLLSVYPCKCIDRYEH